MQTRIYNFGDLETAVKNGRILDSLFYGQVLYGFELSVVAPDTDRVTIQPGTAILTSTPTSIVTQTAKILTEDQVKTVDVANTAAAKNYTLVYVHNDQLVLGGAEATLQLDEGIFTSYTNGLIIGWVIYPGGAVPVTDEMLYPAPKPFRVNPYLRHFEGADVRHPPFHGLHEEVSSIHVTLSTELVSGTVLYKVQCSALAPIAQTVQYLTSHSVKTLDGSLIHPRAVLTQLQIPLTSSVALTMLDSAGVSHDTTSYTNIAIPTDQYWEVDRDFSGGTWTVDGSFALSWEFTLDPGDVIYWGRTAVTERDLPYQPGFINVGP